MLSYSEKQDKQGKNRRIGGGRRAVQYIGAGLETVQVATQPCPFRRALMIIGQEGYLLSLRSGVLHGSTAVVGLEYHQRLRFFTT